MAHFRRNGDILNKEFYKLLMPTMLSALAVSLNEFVDSIIVSRMLGIVSMAMVNMAAPVMLCYAVVFALLGAGGSIVYAKHAGRHEQDAAERAFTIVFVASLIAGLVIMVAGIIFLDPLSQVFCSDESVLPVFRPYLRLVVISGVLEVPLQTVISFMPALGRPKIGTVLNFVANGVNLGMDCIYMGVFNTGINGAALATLSGYLAGALILALLIWRKKLRLPIRKITTKDLPELSDSVTRGAAVSLTQIGYCVKIFFCNRLAMGLEGIDSVAVFSLCMQSVSVVSVAVGGVTGAMLPLASALRGQEDFSGIHLLMRRLMVVQFIANGIILALFELFPQLFMYMYSFQGAYASEATAALRIFSLMFVLRGFIVVFMYYFQIISLKVYAAIISIADGFGVLIPVALVLTSFMGIDGLWTAFPVSAALILVGILITNSIILKCSNGCYQGLLLVEAEDPDISVYDVTIPFKKEMIAEEVADFQSFGEEELLDKKIASVLGLAAAEMLAYTIDSDKIETPEQVDILVKVNSKSVSVDFRCIGKPLDLMSAMTESGSYLDELKHMASSIEYNYVVGMNQTRIIIDKQNVTDTATGTAKQTAKQIATHAEE